MKDFFSFIRLNKKCGLFYHGFYCPYLKKKSNTVHTYIQYSSHRSLWEEYYIFRALLGRTGTTQVVLFLTGKRNIEEYLFPT